MPAYMIAVCQITNPGEGLKNYSQKSAEITARHGGKYLVRGPAGELFEGEFMKGRMVIISEFPTMEALTACYHSEEYQEAKKMREGTGTYDVAFFEGV